MTAEPQEMKAMRLRAQRAEAVALGCRKAAGLELGDGVPLIECIVGLRQVAARAHVLQNRLTAALGSGMVPPAIAAILRGEVQ